MIKVESSNVDSVGYIDGTLYVKFKNGALYKYLDVPKEKAEALSLAESVGKYLNTEIKKAGYTVKRVWDDEAEYTKILDTEITKAGSAVKRVWNDEPEYTEILDE